MLELTDCLERQKEAGVELTSYNCWLCSLSSPDGDRNTNRKLSREREDNPTVAGRNRDAISVSNAQIDAGSRIDSELAWAWDTQSVWSQAADKLKRSLVRARYQSLGLTILAAVLATGASQIGEWSVTAGRAVAGAASVCAGLVALLQAAISRDRVQGWTSARVVSEALKGEVFKFLAGVAPYRGPDRHHQLAVFVQTILDNGAGSADPTVGVKPAHHPLPPVGDVASYISERVRKQIDDYYKPLSAAMAQRARRFRAAAVVLAVIALFLSAATTVSGRPEAAAWSAVITTAIATIAAHAAAARYDAFALEYARAYQQLDRLQRNRLYSSESASEKTDDDFVTAAEAVISAQNQAWMAGTISAAATPSSNAQADQQ